VRFNEFIRPFSKGKGRISIYEKEEILLAKNDKILLDGILDSRVEENIPSNQRDEAFEYLAYQQVLKDYDLSKEELLSGSVDGKDDGGIDAIYIFVNGHLITDITTTFWPKSNGELDIYLFTCKHRDSFKQEPINSLIASIEELLDLSIDVKELKGAYNSDVLEKRAIIMSTYKKLAAILCSFNLTIIYACRGDTSEIGENIKARGVQAETICKQCFSSCDAKFQFWGSMEILKAYRELPNYSLSLDYQECLTQDEQYVVLVKLRDYYRFITNTDGKLRKYLFDSNVRDFMGLTSVNEDILSTLRTGSRADFWWLNNGVTILSTGATIVGKSITINNVQIVNGLQTSECIYRHFLKSDEDDSRLLLIKVLTSQDNFIRDSIIRATNNQTKVETASLHATDKIQRDIEDILKKSGLYYERRINYYVNQGIPDEKIFSPLYLASGYMALILKLPHKAVALKNRFMRQPLQYNRVFSEKTDLKIWPVIAKILRITDTQLEILRTKRNTNVESYLKSVRYTVSLIAVSRLIGKYDFSISDLIALDISLYTPQLVSDTWKFVQECLPPTWNKSNWKRKEFTFDILEKASQKFSITNFECIYKRDDRIFNTTNYKVFKIDNVFLETVHQKLPPQPWPVGIHKTIAAELSAPASKVSQAINLLIEKGLVNRQVDGIVYDSNGDVICDSAR
jgi:hypothetical protein